MTSMPAGHAESLRVRMDGKPVLESERFTTAVEAIYAAAIEPAKWPDALAAIASSTDDVGSVLIYIRDDDSVGTIVSPGLETAQAEYDRKWWHMDIRASRTFQTIYSSELEAVTDRDVVTPAEIQHHPIYSDFLLPHGLGWYCASSVSPDPGLNAFISVQRCHLKAPFSEDERKIVARLARHVELSLRLSIRLMTVEARNVSLAEALEWAGIGVFVLDRSKRIVLGNSVGNALLGDGLTMTNGRLNAQFVGDREQLDERLELVMQGSAVGTVADETPLLLHRPGSGHPLALYVLPLCSLPQRFGVGLFVEGGALLLAVTVKPDAPADPAVVRDVLGITLGEARVASLVGAGFRPRDAAEKLGISAETARNVLKRVFAKTGVARQSELVTLLTRLLRRQKLD